MGRSARERGASEEAMRRGLFAAAYGRSYYDGVVDQMPSFIRVDFPDTADRGSTDYWRTDHAGPFEGHKLVVGGGISSGVADVVPLTHGLTLGCGRCAAPAPRHRYERCEPPMSRSLNGM